MKKNNIRPILMYALNAAAVVIGCAAACALMFVPTVMAYMNIGLYGTLYLVLCITTLAALVLAMLRLQFANSDLKDADTE